MRDTTASSNTHANDQSINDNCITEVGSPRLATAAGIGVDNTANLAEEFAVLATGDNRPKDLRGALDLVGGSSAIGEASKQRYRGSVQKLKKILSRRCDEIPADPASLRPYLAEVMPAAHGISERRWSNIKGDLKSLLMHCGWVSPECRRGLPLSVDRTELLEFARAHGVHAAIRPFLRWSQSRDIPINDLNSAALEDYCRWRETETLDLQPRRTAIAVSVGWRRMQRKSDAWPRGDLCLQSKVPTKSVPLTSLPEPFQRDVAAYLEHLRHPDPLAAEYSRPMAEISVQHVRRALQRSAAYLIAAGTPAETITGINVLVAPPAIRTILLALHAEAGGQWSNMAQNIGTILLVAARRWVKPGDAVIGELEEMRKRVHLAELGLSRRVRDRLAEFSSDDARRALFQLPARGCKIAEQLLRQGDELKAAKLHETCIALGILLCSSIRRRNLAELDIEKHFARDRRGRFERVVIAGAAVKNRRVIDALLPRWLSEKIERHIERFRPLLTRDPKSTALFPSAKRPYRKPDSLAKQIKNLVETQLGCAFNVHLARHLAVDILLERNPETLSIPQAVLGHASLPTTEQIYATRRNAIAQRYYAKITDEITAPAKPRERRSRKETR